VKSGEVELKHRRGGARETLSPEAAVRRLVELVQSQSVLA
jgi:hypothetical protein